MTPNLEELRKKSPYNDMNLGVTSKWFTMEELEVFLNMVRPGDRIEIDRKKLCHWSIYIGEENNLVADMVDPNGSNLFGSVPYSEDSTDLDQQNVITGIKYALPLSKSAYTKIPKSTASVSPQFVASTSIVATSALEVYNYLREESEREKTTLKLEPIISVIGESMFRINNSMDYKFCPRVANLVVELAKYECELNEEKYNVLSNNCEHFVNRMRYGDNSNTAKSDQVSLTSLFSRALKLIM